MPASAQKLTLTAPKPTKLEGDQVGTSRCMEQLVQDVLHLERAVKRGDPARTVAILITACTLTAGTLIAHLSSQMITIWNEL